MKLLHISILACIAMISGSAFAGGLSKEQCVDANSRGQDAKEQGKLSLARKLFLSCAQQSCPQAVQSDCAKFADELSSLQPTIVLVARDGNGNDLPNTTVYLDDQLVMTTIDGKPIDVDPGTHVVKFSHGTDDQVVTVVVGSGEKGRTVTAKFGAPTAPTAPTVASPSQTIPSRPAKPSSHTTHPGGAWLMMVGGGALVAVGSGVVLYGKSQIPSNCSLSTHECAAAPGDPVFTDAASATKTVNIGIVTGVAGIAALTGGLVWYFKGAKTTTESSTQVAPLLTHDARGIVFSGHF